MLSRQMHRSQPTLQQHISDESGPSRFVCIFILVRFPDLSTKIRPGLFFRASCTAGGVRQRQKKRHLPARQQWSRVIPCVVYEAITSASKQRLFAVASVCKTLSAAICFFIDFDHIKNGQASSCQCLAHRGVTLTHHAVPPLGDALKAQRRHRLPGWFARLEVRDELRACARVAVRRRCPPKDAPSATPRRSNALRKLLRLTS